MSQPPRYVEGEAPASQQQSVSAEGSKFKSHRVALLVVSALLAAAVIVIIRLSFAHMDTKRSFQMLRDEHDAVLKNLAADGSCLKCGDGWEQHGEKCYYFSSDKSPWEEARAECRKQGGDLAQIDSREEQSFLNRKVRENMNNTEDLFWIGLTDSKEEGAWVWVDGSPLNRSLTFWSSLEPDNWTGENPDGEDCVRMGEQYGADYLRCWFDKSCKVPHKRICEKSAETGCLV